jgi:hypothetical protein
MRDLGLFESRREDGYDYLISLRDSGVTNMWGAPPYVEKEFSVDKTVATNLFLDWIETF